MAAVRKQGAIVRVTRYLDGCVSANFSREYGELGARMRTAVQNERLRPT